MTEEKDHYTLGESIKEAFFFIRECIVRIMGWTAGLVKFLWKRYTQDFPGNAVKLACDMGYVAITYGWITSVNIFMVLAGIFCGALAEIWLWISVKEYYDDDDDDCIPGPTLDFSSMPRNLLVWPFYMFFCSLGYIIQRVLGLVMFVVGTSVPLFAVFIVGICIGLCIDLPCDTEFSDVIMDWAKSSF